MPRNYVRKRPELTPVTEDQISRAKALLNRGKSKRAAANAVGISESCLRKRLKLNRAASSMGRFKPTFDSEQEKEFAIHCKQMDDRYYGLTINDIRRLAYEYADANHIEHRFDKSCKMAGRDWLDGFLKRHPHLVVRQSAATSLARAMGFNRPQVDRFYKNLKELYVMYKFKPNRIYNVDETGISTVPKKTPKVITTKGKKVVSKIVSAERGITVTALCCMSANGHYIPPALIYPRKRPRDDLLDGGPSQSICMVSDSGFVNSELFVNWLHHFKDFTHPSSEDPVLLLLDNHSSHISLEAVKYARQNNIVMLTLPPHGSHKLQPLDRCFFSPLKTKYAIECDKFMSQHPGRGVTQYEVARLFNEAYKRVATLGNAESGFKVTGIYPYDDDLFDESDFAPSLVTDQLPQDEDREPQESSNNLDEAMPSNLLSDITNKQIEGEIGERADVNDCPSPSILDTFNEECENMECFAFSENVCNDASAKDPCPTKTSNTDTNLQEKKTADTGHVSLEKLSPLPRMKGKRNTRGKVAMKSQVITSSPYKNELQKKQQLQEQKEKNKKTRSKLPLKLEFDEPSSSRKKIPKPATKSSSWKGKPKPSMASTSKTVDYFCPLCKEKYTEPNTEDWIQCQYCKDWWHEECTAYERGFFVCDNCVDDS